MKEFISFCNVLVFVLSVVAIMVTLLLMLQKHFGKGECNFCQRKYHGLNNVSFQSTNYKIKLCESCAEEALRKCTIKHLKEANTK